MPQKTTTTNTIIREFIASIIFLSNPRHSALEITMKICTNLSRGNRFCFNSAQCSVAPKLWRTLENKDVIHLLKWLWFIFQRLPAGDS